MIKENFCLGCMEEKGGAQICPSCGYEKGVAPESALHLPPGTMLQGKYLLGRVLGQGGFGSTYIAWDKTLDLKLAIKEYFPFGLVSRSTNQPKMEIPTGERKEQFAYGLKRYLEEAKTLARFNEHPNIVTVRDYFEANNTAYLVMNYHEGVTLQNYLAGKGGKIPVEQALSIFMPVLDALKEVHAAGILHRDISPDNLLIDKNGRVILIDFGAARQEIREKSKSLSVIMKAGYSPPEQYQSRGKQGPWTDIYAVAASFYRAITGIAPLEAIDRLVEDDLITPSKLGVILEPEKEKALLKALAIKATDRYQAVEDFQAALMEKRSVARKKPSDVLNTSNGKPGKPLNFNDEELSGLTVTLMNIKSKKFERAFKGYDVEGVDIFMNHLAKDLELLLRENSDLKKTLRKALAAKADNHHQAVEDFQAALMEKRSVARKKPSDVLNTSNGKPGKPLNLYDEELSGLTVTPMNIKSKKFKSTFRGYDVKDVDKFMNHLAKDLEQLIRENYDLYDQLSQL